MHPIIIIIPCYNEANRIDRKAFEDYIIAFPDHHLCFVDDGSTDATLEELQHFTKEYPHQVQIIAFQENEGKAEAIRKAMLILSEDNDYE